MDALPRIRSALAVVGGRMVQVTFDDGAERLIDLSGWVATGGEVLAPLRDPLVFLAARIGAHGANIFWLDPEGDLAIDAAHLRMLSDAQMPMRGDDIAEWQSAAGVSNSEAAEMLGVARSTFLAYKAGSAAIPRAIAVVCRAVARDPIIFQSLFRPGQSPGRPRKTVNA